MMPVALVVRHKRVAQGMVLLQAVHPRHRLRIVGKQHLVFQVDVRPVGVRRQRIIQHIQSAPCQGNDACRHHDNQHPHYLFQHTLVLHRCKFFNILLFFIGAKIR